MPWTERGPASCHHNHNRVIGKPREAYDGYLARSWFTNFLVKPPYEPGDKPRFDKGRFLTMVAAGSCGALLSAT
jgi:hypothetical protein